MGCAPVDTLGEASTVPSGVEGATVCVETRQTFERVKEQGCTEAEGYLFGQPRPASDIPALASNRPWFEGQAKIEPTPS
jgi:predicted signal transduction protein with EAL and GGDEF domain